MKHLKADLGHSWHWNFLHCNYITTSSGLNDMPICAVHDGHMVANPHHLLKRPSTGESRQMYAFHIPAVNSHRYRIHNQNPTLNSHRFPINTLTGLSTYPLGFKEKADPKFGLSEWFWGFVLLSLLTLSIALCISYMCL